MLILHNWNLAHQALTAGTIGVAESYIDGDWESPDVTAFLELFLVNVEVGNTLAGGARGLARVMELIRHWLNSNSRSQAKKNISAHYDLGNAFYSKWLDETMTYSSALYQDGANDLASAQTAKYRALAHATGLKSGDHVLEIGCGWGGFAEFAAREIGCRVTGLTISREQLAFARERIEKAGLSDRVDLRFQDYRDETGRYDGVVSIEMFEAVGEKYWPTYFSKVRECLKPGGKAGLQIITIKPDAYQAYRANPDFIQRYVFPGGMLPTENHLKSLGEAAGLELIGPPRLRSGLRPHAGRVARAVLERLGRHPADGLRSALQAPVGVLHVLLRSRFPLRPHQCAPGGVQLSSRGADRSCASGSAGRIPQAISAAVTTHGVRPRNSSPAANANRSDMGPGFGGVVFFRNKSRLRRFMN